jgi:hypothetical protein
VSLHELADLERRSNAYDPGMDTLMDAAVHDRLVAEVDECHLEQ